MTHLAKHPTSSTRPVPVVLFGLDPSGKPQAGRFSEKVAALAAKAAAQLQLHVLHVTDAAFAATVASLPAGRIHAPGRNLVRQVKPDVYAKLLAAAGTPSPPAQGSGGGGADPAGGAADPAGGAPPAAKGGRLPNSWDDIAVGDAVVAQESKDDGWYEALVTDRHADMLILRWRDWPRDRAFSRHRLSVALMAPGQPKAGAAEGKGKAASPAAGKGAAGKATLSADASKALPRTWEEIGVGTLVLAREDGPLRGFWEGIVSDLNGDSASVRWRDYAHVPPVTRPRLALALLHPNGS